MFIRVILLLPFILFGYQGICGQRRTNACTRAKAEKGEKQSAMLNSWGAVLKGYKEYGNCKNEEISKGFSWSIGRLLAYHWDETRGLEIFFNMDYGFKPFVLSHINRTISKKNLIKIQKHLRPHCNEHSYKIFCKRLEEVLR